MSETPAVYVVGRPVLAGTDDLLMDLKLDALDAVANVAEMHRRHDACPDHNALLQLHLAVKHANRCLNTYFEKRGRILRDYDSPAGRLRPA